MPSPPVVLSVFGLEPKNVSCMVDFARELSLQAGELGWNSVLCYSRMPAEHVCRHLQLPNVTLEVLPEPWNANARNILGISRLLRRYRPRILHLHFTGFISPYPWQARLHGVEKVFFTDHGSRPTTGVAVRAPAWKRLAARIINAPMDRVFCISEFGRRWNVDEDLLPAGRFQVIHNGSDLSLMPTVNEDDMRGFRARYGIPDGRHIVLQVSWIIPEKGIPDMIDAAAIVLRERRDVQFVIVGEGDYRQGYTARAADIGLAEHVVFTGTVKSSLAPAYASAAVVCQVSRWQEGFGATITEAMSYCKPVIATSVGGIPEVVVDGETGYIVPPGAPPAIAARILDLLRDPATAARMGQAGRRRAEEKFNIRHTIVEFLRAYGLLEAAPEDGRSCRP